jgi:hypothetical protein
MITVTQGREGEFLHATHLGKSGEIRYLTVVLSGPQSPFRNAAFARSRLAGI